MKNITIILFCFLAFSTSYSQDTKPNKQETMDWIAEKIKNNINPNTNVNTDNGKIWMYFTYSFLNYSNNKVVIQKKYHFRNDDGSLGNDHVETFSIDLTKITSYVSNEKAFVIEGENLVLEKNEDGTKNRNSIYFFGVAKNGDTENITVMSLGLLNRFIKALDALITYNSNNKPKEAY